MSTDTLSGMVSVICETYEGLPKSFQNSPGLSATSAVRIYPYRAFAIHYIVLVFQLFLVSLIE